VQVCEMGWLRLVGSLKLQVSFVKEPYKRDDILQKRPIILRSLLIEATPDEQLPLAVRLKRDLYTCGVLQCVAVCCSVLQCVAVCCSVLQCLAVCGSVLQCVAVCCSVSLSLTHVHTHTHTHTHTHAPWIVTWACFDHSLHLSRVGVGGGVFNRLNSLKRSESVF